MYKKKKQIDETNESTAITKTPEQIQFESESVKRNEKLENGDFGTVYRGECYSNDSVLQRVFISEVRVKSGFESELAHFASLQHPLILPVLGYYEDTFYRKKYLLSFFAEKETMDVYLRGYQQNRKEYADTHHQRRLTSWAIDIACAVKYLHSNKVIHGDLAAHNIFMTLTPESSVKITNFGLWKIVEPSSIHPRALKWAAPEVREEGYYSAKSDMYSFGVLLWQIYSWGAEPYADIEVSSTTKPQILPQPADCPEDIYKLMLECWKVNPEERPYVDQLIVSLSSIHGGLKTDLRPNQGTLLPGLAALKKTLPKQLGNESDFTQLGWYGRIGRTEAEKLLQRAPLGTYLIRWSEKEICYVLSYRQAEGFVHVAGLIAGDDAFLVSGEEELKFEKATDYIQHMKKLSPGIIKSIHEVVLPQMTRSNSRSSGIYVNDDNESTLIVNND